MTTDTHCADGGSTPRTYRPRPHETVPETVLRAVATTSGRSSLVPDDEEALDPLYETIDPDALDALFRTGKDDAAATGSVEFVYCGYRVTVDRTDAVTVADA